MRRFGELWGFYGDSMGRIVEIALMLSLLNYGRP